MHVPSRTSHEPLDDVSLREGPPETGQDHRFRPHSEALAVHQDAVTVEDHQVEMAHADETRDPTGGAQASQ